MSRTNMSEAQAHSSAGLGRWGEAYAANFLEQQGMRIIERNWRCDLGELDIVAVDRSHVVFVEVKTRRDHSRGTPMEAITSVKLQLLRRLAGRWLGEHADAGLRSRIDAIAITRPRSGPTVVQHVRGLE
jgi:putative endonuclease